MFHRLPLLNSFVFNTYSIFLEAIVNLTNIFSNPQYAASGLPHTYVGLALNEQSMQIIEA
jgi:hypothetical protein